MYNDTGAFAGAFALILIFVGGFMVLSIIPFWLSFKKMGYPGWWSLIPFFNTYKLAEAAGRPGIWGLAGFLNVIPILGTLAFLYIWFVMMQDLARSWKKDSAWAILLTFLPWVGFLILGLGDSRYHGPAGPEPQHYQPAFNTVATAE